MALRKAGPDYCRAHNGIREEDEELCDNAEEFDCATCEGSGEVDDEDCLDCNGTGTDPCDLTPLLYEDGQKATVTAVPDIAKDWAHAWNSWS